jgi:hypothetical protein
MGVGRRCKAIMALGIVGGASDHDLKPSRRLINDSYSVADKRAR